MLNTCASGVQICSTVSFSILGAIPSTPGDLFYFILLILLATTSGVTTNCPNLSPSDPSNFVSGTGNELVSSRVVVDGEVSSWKPVLSGMPQGSVLGPILFLVYINDLEEGVTGKLLKFADDTKLFRKGKEIGDKQNLQEDIDKLVKWSDKWQMLFNFGKCKCLHTGPGNTGMNYEMEMGGTIISKTVKEKYLGVTMNA